MVGCAAAAFLAEAGARVDLYESGELAGAASGRNSGVLQHPFDPVMAELHAETMEHLRALDGIELPPEPAGILMVSGDGAALERADVDIVREAPELSPRLLGERELRELEPALARGLRACRLKTGYPVQPAAVTLALARRARRAGARLHEHEPAWPWVVAGQTRGVLAAGLRRPADRVLVAAGPWTPEVVDPTGSWRPIAAVWGVVVELRLEDAPSHVVEEVGVEDVAGGGAGAGAVFSAVTAGGITSVGSTFLRAEPDPRAWVPRLLERAVRFLPAVGAAPVLGVRACARPQALDGRPLVGELEDPTGLWVAAGHGPWGISTGAATGRLVAGALLETAVVPPELSVERIALPSTG